MFGKKKNNQKKFTNTTQDIEVNINESDKTQKSNKLDRGMYSLKDIIAPSAVDRSDPNSLMVDGKYVRNFIMQGFPSQVYVGWLDSLFSYDGDMDICIHIEPVDDKEAIRILDSQLTKFEAQLTTDTEKGTITNRSHLEDAINGLREQEGNITRNVEKLFQVQISCNLFANSKEDLDSRTEQLNQTLRGRKIYMMPTYLRQDEGYKSTLPYGKTYIPDMFRNFSSGALTACFPFYNGNICHKTGTFCGINISTWTPIIIDFYDRKKIINSNITVIGQAGAGKTFFVSLLTMRSVANNIRTVIIDPEDEYRKLTEALGGSYIVLAPGSDECINPFDIEESDIVDEDGIPLGGTEVLIKEKCSDILNLIATMVGNLTGSESAIVSDLTQQLYKDRGITENPKSLYNTTSFFDKDTKEFYPEGSKKIMPTLSDLQAKLIEYAKKNNDANILELSNTLKLFVKGGIYDMFDCHTSKNLKNFENRPIITFNIMKLEEKVLRPIGMYVALQWTWEKFAKKNPHIKKRIVCDEAWMLVKKEMAGAEYSGTFLETASRRIRKRNGGLLVASQNFSEFISTSHGQAVMKNAAVNIFLKQDSTDADALKRTFKLSDGEIEFLITAKKGELLMRVNNQSLVLRVVAFDYEKALIEKRTTLAS